jgi:transposase InsO family protein
MSAAFSDEERHFTRLRSSADQLYAVASRAYGSRVILARDERARLNLLLKPVRHEARTWTRERMESHADRCDALREHYESLLASALAPRSDEPSLPRSPRRQKRGVRQSRLEFVPPAKGASAPRPVSQAPTLAELARSPGKLEEIGDRHRLVRLMDEGLSARQALIQAGLDPSRKRWAQKLYKRYVMSARSDLLDRRWTRISAKTVMTQEVERMVLSVYQSRRGANIKAIWRHIRDEIARAQKEAGIRGVVSTLKPPSYDTVVRYIRNLPEALKTVRNEGLTQWHRAGRVVLDRVDPPYGNAAWQIDHTQMDTWVRVEALEGVWIAQRVWLTLVLDWHSRGVAGYHISTKEPDSWSLSLALRHAIGQKKDGDSWPLCGIPERLLTDRGADFMSRAAEQYLRALGITPVHLPPHYPDGKAEIERAFGTFKKFLSALPGQTVPGLRSTESAMRKVSHLLTLDEFKVRFEKAVNEYHVSTHSGIDGETPVNRWLKSARVNMPLSADDLNILLLKDDQIRIIGNKGIRFQNANYRPANPILLHSYWKQPVNVRYNPEDLESILVFSNSTGEELFEAFKVGTLNDSEAILAANVEFKKALKARTVDYVREVDAQDRRAARNKSANLARAKQEAQRAQDKRHIMRTAKNASAPNPKVLQLIQDRERRARGEE